jgi:hypothetical protein
VEWRGEKTQKPSESEGRCGRNFVARRLVHDALWECDDESVKRYNQGEDEREEGEIGAVILQKTQNSGQMSRTEEEIITQEDAQREVERWWKLPHAGPDGEGVGARLRHWRRIHQVGGLSPERIERGLRTWPELDLHMQLACKLKSRRNEGGMGYQGTGFVSTGTLSRGERDTGEKREGATRRAENGRRFR